MIEACSVNVVDLKIYRRTQTGEGGKGTDVVIARDLRAHEEEGAAGTLSTGGRDVVITNTLMIDGIDKDGDSVLVRAHDLAQWTDWRGVKTDKLAIAKVAPLSQPGMGPGVAGLAHVRLDIGN